MEGSWVGRQVQVLTKFRKRSKAVQLLSEEHYLRDDIPCGVESCPSGCLQESPSLAKGANHYLVPDAQAILDYEEILELPQVTGVIYLASVLKSVFQRLNQRKHTCVKSLYGDRRRRSAFFDDEHCLYTWLMRQDFLRPNHPSSETGFPSQVQTGQKGGKQNGLNASVQAAAAWFAEHLQQRTTIVLLSDQETSEDVRLRLLRSGVQVLSGSAYFRTFWRHDLTVVELFESLEHSRSEAAEAVSSKSSKAVGKGGVYPLFLPAHAIEEGLSSGSIRIGVFQVSRQAADEAFVRPSNKGEASRHEIFVPGRRLQNRALQGDQVAVRLLPREQWKSPKVGLPRAPKIPVPLRDPLLGPDEKEVEAELEANGIDSDLGKSSGERSFEKGGQNEGQNVPPTGEVVGIVQRAVRDYVACLQQDDEESLGSKDSGKTEAVLAVPMNRRIPFVRLRTRQVARLAGQRFVVRIDGWDADSGFPHGHVARIVGPMGDLKAESESLLVENSIEVAPFSSGALQELPATPWRIPPEELSARRDLRSDHRACSIDPPGSKDVDDVLSVRWLPDGTAEVGVHIADVSYFVRHDSLLDLEARARGTTVYLVDRRFDMLPKLLSEDLCSLVGGQDRLAVSIIWRVDPSGPSVLGKPWFGRTVIHNRHQLSYPQAQVVLDGGDLANGGSLPIGRSERELLQSDLSLLAGLSRAWRDKREAAGALELASAELRFETDQATGQPRKIITKQELQVNWVVAELMIAANSAVAERIVSAFPSTSLLRHHAPPRADGFEKLQECFEAYGLPPLDVSSNKGLAESLDRTRGLHPTVQNALRAMATRAMSEAQYFCTGAQSEETKGLSGFYHYGLALDFYTHFTSPIRRYADVLVHRQLIAALESAELKAGLPFTSGSKAGFGDLVSAPVLEEMADHLNERHRASKRAQKECAELYLLLYLQSHSVAEKAIIVGVHAQGLMVFVPKYDLRGPVYLKDKNGKLLLPLKSESEIETAHHTLQKEGKQLRILDVQKGTVAYEFGLMQPVWVELKADGSRAHMPTLKIRLLADEHPAVRAATRAEAEEEVLSRYGGAFGRPSQSTGRPSPSANASKTRAAAIAAMGREAAHAQETAKAEQMRRDEEMARALQALEVGAVASGQRRMGDRKSIHDVIEDFRRLVEENEGDFPPGTSASEPQVEVNVTSSTRTGRHLYQLQRRASRARAKRLRSILVDTDMRQKRREARELEARGRAAEIAQGSAR